MIIYIIGLVLSIMAVLDIFKKNISLPWKLLWTVGVLVFSWIGLIAYYAFLKNHIEGWCK